MADDSLTVVNSYAEYYALRLTYPIHSNYWVIKALYKSQFCRRNFKPMGSFLHTPGFCLVMHGCKVLIGALKNQHHWINVKSMKALRRTNTQCYTKPWNWEWQSDKYYVSLPSFSFSLSLSLRKTIFSSSRRICSAQIHDVSWCNSAAYGLCCRLH